MRISWLKLMHKEHDIMKYLIVVAHPDDEVLGAGASIYKWTRKDDVVDVCIM